MTAANCSVITTQSALLAYVMLTRGKPVLLAWWRVCDFCVFGGL